MTTACSRFATADELAEAVVTQRLKTLDSIDIRYDGSLIAPYGVDRDKGLIILPEGVTWRQAHARINRCWLYLLGGTALADEFAPVRRDHPDRRIVTGGTVTPFPVVRQLW